MKYNTVGTAAIIKLTVPHMDMLVRAKIISRCLTITRYKVRDNDHFSYRLLELLFV